MDINETLNELLVKLFRNINAIEEQAIRTEEYRNVTANDIHVIEAIGLDAPKNMTSVARTLAVTTGTLTIAMNSLVKKGYVQRVQRGRSPCGSGFPHGQREKSLPSSQAVP